MTDDKAPTRPRQVTTTVIMAIVFDVVLLTSLFDTLARLRAPETRDAFDEVLGSPPGSGLGLTTDQVVEGLRVLVFLSGALAAIALVFAVFVLQRHRAARIGYTVSAALLLLTVPAAGLLPVFVALAAVPMWSRAARNWYAGRMPVPAGDARAVPLLSQEGPPPAPAPYGTRPGGGEGHGATTTPDAPGAQPRPLYGPPAYGPPSTDPAPIDPRSTEPPPTEPPSTEPPSTDPPPYALNPYGQSPYGQSPYGPGRYSRPAYPPPAPAYAGYPIEYRNPDRRPLTVTIAAVLTWIGAGVTAMLMIAFVAILAVGGDAFVREFERAAQRSNLTLTANQAMAVGWTVAAVFLVWSIAAIVLAVLAFRRGNAARIALVVSSGATALLSLLGIASGISAITLVLGIATVVLLFTGGANPWYSRRSDRGYPPPPGPRGPSYPQPAERPKPW